MFDSLYAGVEPEVRFICKIYTFQLSVIIFLMIITPLYPDGEITGWLYDFLPPSFFVAEYFPLTSKVINNYVAFSTPILGILLFLKNNHFFQKRLEYIKKKQGSYFRVLLCSLCFILGFMIFYFGYTGHFLIDFNEGNFPHSTRNGFLLENYIFFGLLTSPMLSLIFIIAIPFFLISSKMILINLFNFIIKG